MFQKMLVTLKNNNFLRRTSDPFDMYRLKDLFNDLKIMVAVLSLGFKFERSQNEYK